DCPRARNVARARHAPGGLSLKVVPSVHLARAQGIDVDFGRQLSNLGPLAVQLKRGKFLVSQAPDESVDSDLACAFAVEFASARAKATGGAVARSGAPAVRTPHGFQLGDFCGERVQLGLRVCGPSLFSRALPLVGQCDGRPVLLGYVEGE